MGHAVFRAQICRRVVRDSAVIQSVAVAHSRELGKLAELGLVTKTKKIDSGTGTPC